MTPKMAAVASSAIMGFNILLVIVALAIPGWTILSLSSDISIYTGPIYSCAGASYFDNCVANDNDCNDNSECMQLVAAEAFLIIGGFFTIFSLISLLVGALRNTQQISASLKIISAVFHLFAAISFIISFALVANVVADYTIPGYTMELGPSFGLTVAAAGFSIIALLLFGAYNLCMKADAFASPLIGSGYNGATTALVYQQPYSQAPAQQYQQYGTV